MLLKNEIVIFENGDIKLDVNIKDETVWLNREQMSELFDRDIKTIGKHINNALKEELKNEVVVAKFATTTKHGMIKGKTQTHMVDYYNLDMIISVGYRVKSKKGIIFRKWANKIIKDYLIKGYAVNERRLEYLEKTIKLIDIASRMDKEIGDKEAKGYDNKSIKKIKGSVSNEKITYRECKNIINTLRFNESSTLFAIEKDNGLESIINDIYGTFDGEDVYKTTEEKAANILYLIVKNHVFIDGNKRIAATIFIYFLNFYNLLYREGKMVIDNNTLTSLTILIAQSNPKEKEVLVDLVMNFLSED